MSASKSTTGSQRKNLESGTTGSNGNPGTRKVVDLLRDHGAAIGMLAVLGVFGILKPAVMKPANLGNILQQSASLVILATGFAIAMIVRGIDLSAAQVSDAAGLAAGYFLVHGQPLWMVFVIPLAFGLLIGVVNGALMAYLGVPALIGTLGMMFVVRSIELVLSHSEPQTIFALAPDRTRLFNFLGQGSIGPINFSVILAIVVVVLAHVVMTRSTLGRYFDALGGNVRAVLLAGVRHRVFAAAFILSSLFAAVAGMMQTSRAGLAIPRAFEANLLNVFVAVYLGSMLVRSGKINILGSAAGAIFVGLISNALTLMGAGVAARYFAYGAIILIAMTVGSFRRRV
jgi:ribose/xylose/arabinose/galactoside ABC-type transport system permease subunit